MPILSLSASVPGASDIQQRLSFAYHAPRIINAHTTYQEGVLAAMHVQALFHQLSGVLTEFADDKITIRIFDCASSREDIASLYSELTHKDTVVEQCNMDDAPETYNAVLLRIRQSVALAWPDLFRVQVGGTLELIVEEVMQYDIVHRAGVMKTPAIPSRSVHDASSVIAAALQCAYINVDDASAVSYTLTQPDQFAWLTDDSVRTQLAHYTLHNNGGILVPQSAHVTPWCNQRFFYSCADGALQNANSQSMHTAGQCAVPMGAPMHTVPVHDSTHIFTYSLHGTEQLRIVDKVKFRSMYPDVCTVLDQQFGYVRFFGDQVVDAIYNSDDASWAWLTSDERLRYDPPMPGMLWYTLENQKRLSIEQVHQQFKQQVTKQLAAVVKELVQSSTGALTDVSRLSTVGLHHKRACGRTSASACEEKDHMRLVNVNFAQLTGAVLDNVVPYELLNTIVLENSVLHERGRIFEVLMPCTCHAASARASKTKCGTKCHCQLSLYLPNPSSIINKQLTRSRK